jgi:hypothetical protein
MLVHRLLEKQPRGLKYPELILYPENTMYVIPQILRGYILKKREWIKF